MFHRANFIFLLMIVSILGGCQASDHRIPKEKNGIIYGETDGSFRHKWWNYYERALSFTEGGFWEDARLDLKEAIRQKNDDKRRARKYGRHFTDYFPRRELGIIYYKQGKIEASVHELTASLKTVKSARAEFYLDRARRKLIEKKQSDLTPPEIIIRTHRQPLLTNAFSVVVQGIAKDDTYVRHVRVGNNNIRVDVSEPQIAFEMEISLEPGRNEIPVSVTDLSGKTSCAFFTADVDRVGPIIGFEPVLSHASEKGIELNGYAFDKSGLAAIFINEQKFPLNGSTAMDIQKILYPRPDAKELVIRVRDRAGNVTSAEVPLDNNVKETGNVNLLAQNICSSTVLSDRPDMIMKSVLTAQNNTLREGNPPEIELKTPKNKRAVTYLAHAAIEGKVRDESKIKSLYINGKNILPGPCKNPHFSELIELRQGDNSINIQAVDAYGNASPSMLWIKREEPVAERQESRLRIATHNKNKSGSSAFSRHLNHEIRRRKRFIIEDLNLSQDEVGEKTVLDAGKDKNIDCVMFVEFVESGNSLTVNGWLKDTEDRDYSIVELDVYDEDINPDKLKKLSRIMEVKLTDELPVVRGKVAKTGGEKITVDIGREKKVKEGMKLIVYHTEEPIQNADGNVVDRNDRQLGEARLESVGEGRSDAVLYERDSQEEIQAEQKVITR